MKQWYALYVSLYSYKGTQNYIVHKNKSQTLIVVAFSRDQQYFHLMLICLSDREVLDIEMLFTGMF